MTAGRIVGWTELGVAGTNAPATALYESIGMVSDFRFEVWELTRDSRRNGGERRRQP